jgi:hypothetical protein
MDALNLDKQPRIRYDYHGFIGQRRSSDDAGLGFMRMTWWAVF